MSRNLIGLNLLGKGTSYDRVLQIEVRREAVVGKTPGMGMGLVEGEVGLGIAVAAVLPLDLDLVEAVVNHWNCTLMEVVPGNLTEDQDSELSEEELLLAVAVEVLAIYSDS